MNKQIGRVLQLYKAIHNMEEELNLSLTAPTGYAAKWYSLIHINRRHSGAIESYSYETKTKHELSEALDDLIGKLEAKLIEKADKHEAEAIEARRVIFSGTTTSEV